MLLRTYQTPAVLWALLLSVSAHGAVLARAALDLFAMREFEQIVRSATSDAITRMLEVDVMEPAPSEPPPPDEPPHEAPAPAAQPRPAAKAPAAPPAAAQAGKTMTSEDAHASADFTMVQGAGDAYVGGVTASNGTATGPVYDRGARASGVAGGVPGGTATAPGTPDLSRAASPASFSWNCSPLFPAEADADDINTARVTIVVSVRPDGSVSGVSVLNDPGHGFGRAARTCALSQRFTPALDRAGQPVAGKTAPIPVLFTR